LVFAELRRRLEAAIRPMIERRARVPVLDGVQSVRIGTGAEYDRLMG
jgi:hypothetical protein